MEEKNMMNIKTFNFRKATKICIICVAAVLAFLMIAFSMKAYAQENKVEQSSKKEVAQDASGLYNLTVCDTVVGMDDAKWEGTGEDLHYSYSNASFSYKFYPATNKLVLEQGTFTKYFSYKTLIETKEVDVEVSGIVSCNDLHDEISKQGVMVDPIELTDILHIEVANDITFDIGNHKHTIEPKAEEGIYYCYGIYAGEAYLGSPGINVGISGNCKINFKSSETLCADGVSAISVEQKGEEGKLFLGENNTNLKIDIGNINLQERQDTAWIMFFSGIYATATEIEENVIVNIHNINVNGPNKMGEVDGVNFGKAMHIKKNAQVRFNYINCTLGKSQQGYPSYVHGVGGPNDCEDIIIEGYIGINDIPDSATTLNCVYKTQDDDIHAECCGIYCGNSRVEVKGNITINHLICNTITTKESYCKNASTYLMGLATGQQLRVCEDAKIEINKNDDFSLNATLNGDCDDHFNIGNVGLDNGREDFFAEDNAKIFILTSKSNIQNTKDCEINFDTFGIFARGFFHAKDKANISSSTNQSIFNSPRDASINYNALRMSDASLSGESKIYLDTTKSPSGKAISFDLDIDDGITLNDDARLIALSTPGYSVGHHDGKEQDVFVTSELYKPRVLFGKSPSEATEAFELTRKQIFNKSNSYLSIENNNFVFNVTFDSTGGSTVQNQKVHKNDLVPIPENPTKEGFDFAGWYDNSTYTGQAYNFQTPVTNNLCLYAKWTEKANPPQQDDTASSVATGDLNYLFISVLLLAILGSVYYLVRLKKN